MAKNPLFAILWLALLVFIAWPVAGICAAVWIFLQVKYEEEKDRVAQSFGVKRDLIIMIYHSFSFISDLCSRLKLSLTL